MANYKTHKNIGILSAAIALGGVTTLNTELNYFNINNASMVVFFLLAVIGSLLPDVDLKISKPTKILRSALAIFITVLYILNISIIVDLLDKVLANTQLIDYSSYIAYGSALVIPYLLSYTTLKIIQGLTYHRGIIHSVPFAVLFSLGIIALLSSGGNNGMIDFKILSFDLSTDINFVVLGFFLGFITHLILDEAFSVDFRNRKMKKSFGTALSFYSSKNPLGYLVIYLAIIGSVKLMFI